MRKEYFLAIMGFVISWMIAVWERIMDIVGWDLQSMVINLIVLTIGFFFLAWLFEKYGE